MAKWEAEEGFLEEEALEGSKSLDRMSPCRQMGRALQRGAVQALSRHLETASGQSRGERTVVPKGLGGGDGRDGVACVPGAC